MNSCEVTSVISILFKGGNPIRANSLSKFKDALVHLRVLTLRVEHLSALALLHPIDPLSFISSPILVYNLSKPMYPIILKLTNVFLLENGFAEKILAFSWDNQPSKA